MRQSDDPALDAMLNKPRRCVALHRDDDEFVITFQPEDSIAFRSHDAKALRKVCAFLRWKIVSNTSLTHTPLHPIAEWGRQRFGGADTPAERRLAGLENTLAQGKLDAVENAPLLAPLLDIPLPKERLSTLAIPKLDLDRA